ncbi:GPW/gp25 family protein [Sporomusa sphaeroides DSM 2875]|uniref:GPW/gp25 family protein n=1 Tax=Sporomusa sphaeroides TaxID=47679 RepID=UPI00202F0B64|nr:GPW/gp25 family protein [Sporomusa sphaeroides]MCM0759615.1 GPW/gp25 family protein [Sporomusa sphaeroides DSM 2875]
MEIEITAAASTSVIFAPATAVEEIFQNVRTVLATPVYSVPLNRAFGVNAELLDLPLPVAKAKLTAEIVQAIQKFEPRVEVTRVSFNGEPINGRLQPTVRIRLKE